MKRSKLTLMILLVLVFLAQAQTWYTYPELGNAAPTAIIETEDGYVHTGGSFNVPGGGCYLAKTNKSDGTLQWYRYYPSLFNEQSCGDDLVQTPDNGFAILSTDDMGFGNIFRIIKTNALGETFWNRLIAPQNQPVGPPYQLEFFSPDSGFILGGMKYVGSGVILARTNRNGETLWTRFDVGHESTYLCSDIRDLKTRGDKIYLLGSAGVRPGPTGGFIYRTFLAEISSVGNISGKNEYLDSQNRWVHLKAEKFCLLPDSGFLMAGERWIGNMFSDSNFIFLMKTNAARTMLWRKFYQTKSFGFYDGYVTALWQNENTIAMAVTFYDSTYRPTTGLITTDIQGNLLNFSTYPHPTYNWTSLRAAIPTSNNQALLAGRVPPLSGQVFLLKISLSGIEEERTTIQFSSPCLKVFPNPSTGKIHFQIANGQTGKLKIYDASGRMIKETEIQNQVRLNFPAGVYFYQLKNQNGKIVVLEK